MDIEELPEPMTKVSIVQQRKQNHKPARTSVSMLESYMETDARIEVLDNDEDYFANMEDVSETCDEG